MSPTYPLLQDGSFVQAILEFLFGLPPAMIYVTVGAGAAVENVFPPVPADTFVLLGAFLAAQGRAAPLGVFLATWAANVATAILIYGLGRRWGSAFFATPVGRWLLRPRQLERLGRWYEEYGSLIIFLSRFLPGFRAVVPVFAGVSRLGVFRTAIPLAVASGIWYGLLVYLGVLFGRNWRALLAAIEDVNAVLLVIAIALAVLLTVVWWQSRRKPGGIGEGG